METSPSHDSELAHREQGKTLQDTIPPAKAKSDVHDPENTSTNISQRNGKAVNKDYHFVPNPPIAQISPDPPPLVISMQLNVGWLILLGLSFGTRLWQLTTPKYVVFDEVHFGKFTNFFVQNKFFFDVHPPLGKLFYALTVAVELVACVASRIFLVNTKKILTATQAMELVEDDDSNNGYDDQLYNVEAYIVGYDGNFPFEEIGQELGEYESFVWIFRFIPAFLGSLIAPCIYEIILEFGCSHWAASLGAFLTIFENMLIVQTRFMFIDGHLLFFTVMSLLCYLKFRKQSDSAFSPLWWTWLVLLGLSLLGAVSTKYCGFMTLLVLGIVMGIDYWRMIGDASITPRQLIQHLSARALCLGFIPLCLYILQFYVMFTVLYKTGPHDDLVSSAFQASLEGGLAKITHGQAQEVAYGSQITLRHTFGRQCWLHSHAHNYPIKYPDGRGSSHQQQVTCYSFKDVNNWWIVKDPKVDSLNVDFPPRPVINGDIIQIVHGVSGRALNSHDVAAPMSPTNQEVSCYIDYNISMSAQNLWKVEIVNPDATNKWRTIHSQVRFVHVNTSQAIKVTGMQLPDWAFHQFEVATDRVIKQQDTTWNVEEHQQNITYPENYNPEEEKKKQPEEQKHEPIPMPFFYKFIEMQFKMIQSNKELSGEHTFSSTPAQWPILKRGVAYWIHNNKNMQIYCLGNPIVWWVASLSVLGYGALLVLYLLRRRRAVFDIDQDSWNNFCFVGYFLVIGYLFHYLPYFIMDRTLFIHHYLPALLFKIVLLSVFIEHVYNFIEKYYILRYGLLASCVILCLVVLVTYHYFSPFTYGHLELTSHEINKHKWLSAWDMLSHPDT